MLDADNLPLICVAYVAVLFVVAWIGERRATQGKMAWLRSPVIYTFSISVYCTSWTFYGAVGSAARNGLEFITIYLGPTLVFIGWWWCLRKLIAIGRRQRITSVADLISSRYGKSTALAVVVTLIAVVATTPYIALQLQSVAQSYGAISGDLDQTRTAFWVAVGMAVFTVLFATRSVDASERHHGVVVAIAFEALVKLAAMLAVGAFVVFGVMGGIGETFARMPEDMIEPEEVFGPRWAALTFLSATAIILLPRQFQVTVVENQDEGHLVTASWLFPLYLFLMCLFVVPIAIAGLTTMPAGSNPDMFMLTVPLAAGQDSLALLAFIGGFSSATSMVIVAAMALSTMVSNHVVMPLTLRWFGGDGAISGDLRDLLLLSRRICIASVLALGFLYYQVAGGSENLASMGLMAFAGIAQVLPSFVGALYWRGATAAGALAGLIAGFLLWAYTLFLPSFGGGVFFSTEMLADGPAGIALLRPHELLGLTGFDPLLHALIWSLGINVLLFVVISQLSKPGALEQVQSAHFVDVFRSGGGEGLSFVRREAAAEDLFVLAQRILGAEAARHLFDDMARAQGRDRGLPIPTDAMIARLERELAGSVGAASSHAMVSQASGSEIISLTELIDIADETQRLISTSGRLAEKTTELERTAAELREANTRLRALDAQKDDFLSQVSHELRTPMTSIRSFSEILLDPALDAESRARFVSIIHEESMRLTRLLDEILDINRLESGVMDLPLAVIDAEEAVRGAVDTLAPVAAEAGVQVLPHPPFDGQTLWASPDRLRQVLINLISNAIKYNTHPEPTVEIAWHVDGKSLCIDIIDNGGGVTRSEADDVFSKFVRGQRSHGNQGAGLGLPISRVAMRRMGGDLSVVFREDQSSFFRVRVPRLGRAAERAEAEATEPGEAVAPE
ncbi:MAG: sensor histidine kinase [Pseudomonadota bacterium]